MSYVPSFRTIYIFLVARDLLICFTFTAMLLSISVEIWTEDTGIPFKIWAVVLWAKMAGLGGQSSTEAQQAYDTFWPRVR